MKKMLQNFVDIISDILFGTISQLFDRIHCAQSVTLLWIAYRIGVARWCNTTQFFTKMV